MSGKRVTWMVTSKQVIPLEPPAWYTAGTQYMLAASAFSFLLAVSARMASDKPPGGQDGRPQRCSRGLTRRHPRQAG